MNAYNKLPPYPQLASVNCQIIAPTTRNIMDKVLGRSWKACAKVQAGRGGKGVGGQRYACNVA